MARAPASTNAASDAAAEAEMTSASAPLTTAMLRPSFAAHYVTHQE